MGVFDSHPYPILLAEEINSMFMKIENSYFVADFIWSQENAARIYCYFLPMRDGFQAFLTHKLNRIQTYIHSSWVLLLKMLDGNFFNWLLSNNLTKVTERSWWVLKMSYFS